MKRAHGSRTWWIRRGYSGLVLVHGACVRRFGAWRLAQASNGGGLQSQARPEDVGRRAPASGLVSVGAACDVEHIALVQGRGRAWDC